MARSALIDAVATLFFAVRLAVHTPPNSQLVLHSASTRTSKLYRDADELYQYLRWQASLRTHVATPSIILVPWKQPARAVISDIAVIPDELGAALSKEMIVKDISHLRDEASQRTISKLEDKVGYVEEALVCSQQEIASLRDKLAKAESSIRKYERRRSRMCNAIAKSAQRIKDTYGCETNINISRLSNNNNNNNINTDRTNRFVDTSPVSDISSSRDEYTPRSSKENVSPHDKENVGNAQSLRGKRDSSIELEKVRVENSLLKKQLEESRVALNRAEESRKSRMEATPVRARALPVMCDSSPISSPEVEITAPMTGGENDAEMLKMLAYKEATYARNRCEAMEAELEELRSYKRHVREWVVSFVETARREKNALYGQLAASQLSVNELKQVSINQETQVREEIHARVRAQSQLNALRAHHNTLANQLAARNAQLEAAHGEMVAARNAYEQATREENGIGNSEAQREKQELQSSLANMANLANHTQTRLAIVEKQLAEEKINHKKTVQQVQNYHHVRMVACQSSSSPSSSSSSSSSTSSPSSSSSKHQRGLRSFLSPSKKKRHPLAESQLPQVPVPLFLDLE